MVWSYLYLCQVDKETSFLDFKIWRELLLSSCQNLTLVGPYQQWEFNLPWPSEILSAIPCLPSLFFPYFVGELSTLNIDVTAKVVHHPPTLPALFDNVCLDGTVYILPFSLKRYKPCIMMRPVELWNGNWLWLRENAGKWETSIFKLTCYWLHKIKHETLKSNSFPNLSRSEFMVVVGRCVSDRGVEGGEEGFYLNLKMQITFPYW